MATVQDASGTTAYSYDAVGNLSGYAYLNGVQTSYTYNSLNRLTNLQSVCGSAAAQPPPRTVQFPISTMRSAIASS
ncbi:MAG TPA: RHS repeat domain-containing protein [Candidatus Angelobacter sp.]